MSRWLLGGAFLLLTVGTGVTMILAAAGVVPVDDRDFGAPRWIVAVLGGAFALAFFTAASIFLTWAVLSGAEGRHLWRSLARGPRAR